MLDNRIRNLVIYAKRIEGDIYVIANSRVSFDSLVYLMKV